MRTSGFSELISILKGWRGWSIFGDVSALGHVITLVLACAGVALAWWFFIRPQHRSRGKLERSQRQAASIVRLTLGSGAGGGDLNLALRDLTESAARVLGVEYASVWLKDPSCGKLKCAVEFDATSMTHSNGMAIPASECASYLEVLSLQRSIACEDTVGDARFAQFNGCYPQDRRSAATLDAAVGVAGKLVGVVRHQSNQARAWQEDEIAFACAVADHVSHVLLLEERKKAEAELERLTQARKLAELSGSLAHELNQPLTAILINAEAGQQLLNAGKLDDGEMRELLSDIASDARRAGDVMRRLREMYIEGNQPQK